MSRKKSYSSELRRILDHANALVADMVSFSDTISELITDAEKYHEIEPMLKDIARTAAIIEPPPGEPRPGDLCKTCKNGDVKDFDCTHDAAAACSNFEPLIPAVKRQRKQKVITPPGPDPRD